MKVVRPFLVAALLAAAAVGYGQSTRPASSVTLMKLPLELPAIGNFDAVRQWRLGRLHEVERTIGADIVLRIRTADGTVHRLIAPAAEFSELVWRSNWVSTPAKAQPGRSDYVERMIAFDADANNRIIALMSLEPVKRDQNRLWRALRR